MPIIAAALCMKSRGLLTNKSGGEGRRPKKRVAGVYDDAWARHAVSRYSSKQECREARCLADRCTSIRPLRDAALRPHFAQGYRRREKRRHRKLEQRSNRCDATLSIRRFISPSSATPSSSLNARRHVSARAAASDRRPTDREVLIISMCTSST